MLPALLIGVGSGLVLLGVSRLAERVQHWFWGAKFPGGTGPDPATRGPVDPPLPVRVLPGLVPAVVVTLAGGVSPGPKEPDHRDQRRPRLRARHEGNAAHPRDPLGLARGAGTIGALFGTPVAAALILSEISGGSDPRPLWDRLFAPLDAAGAGALTTVLLAGPMLSVRVAPYPGPRLIDAVSAMAVASAAALVGLAAVYVFPFVHRVFHLLAHPVAMLTAGGLVLGLLGVLGGRLTWLGQPCRVTAISIPSTEAAVARAIGTEPTRAWASMPRATPTKTAGKILPPWKPQDAATTSATSFTRASSSRLPALCSSGCAVTAPSSPPGP